MLLGFLFRLLSNTCFGVSNMLWKDVMKVYKNYIIIFYRTIWSAGIFGLSVWLYIRWFNPAEDDVMVKPLANAEAWDWLFAIGLCLFSFWGLYFFTRSVAVGKFSLVGPLGVISAVFSFITAAIVYDDGGGWLFVPAMILLVACLVLHQWEHFKLFRFSPEVLLSLLSSIFWGVSFALFLIPIETFGVLWFSFILELCVLFSACLLIIWHWKSPAIFRVGKKGIVLSVAIGTMVLGGVFFSNLAFTQMSVKLNIMLVLYGQAIAVAYGYFFHSELLSKKDWIMISGATLACILVMF